jgi:hypothetical protein
VIFFQRHPAEPADEIEPPVEPSHLLKGEETRTADMVIPIQVSDAEYALLMHALHPEVAPVLNDLEILPEPKVPGVAEGTVQPPSINLRVVSPDRPPGTPIV